MIFNFNIFIRKVKQLEHTISRGNVKVLQIPSITNNHFYPLTKISMILQLQCQMDGTKLYSNNAQVIVFVG